MNDTYKRIIDMLSSFDEKDESKKELVKTFQREFLSYLYVIGGADRKITDRELNYINANFNFSITEDDFKKQTSLWVKKKGKFSYECNIVLYYIIELVDINNYRIATEVYNLIHNLYKDAGLEYLKIDNDIAKKEMEWYTRFNGLFFKDFIQCESNLNKKIAVILNEADNEEN